ncbi:hypothetical protein E0H80_09395 [Acinetobacter sp. ANC 4779]|nr:hypothetical protein E0H80_09395 [Acinetobacter sp. ANC 4779]
MLQPAVPQWIVSNVDSPHSQCHITYIRTHEGWVYLAVVIDLFSRLVVGWSMKSRITTDLVLDPLLMAI